jgi:hypothetical protein
VNDPTTGLTWARFDYSPASNVLNQAEAASYCAAKGARPPTMDEALAIAGSHYCQSAWSGGWYTWTSTPADEGHVWVVNLDGSTGMLGVGGSGYALCVC